MPQLLKSSGQTGYEEANRRQKLADMLAVMSLQGKPDLSHRSPIVAVLEQFGNALAAKKAQDRADLAVKERGDIQNKDMQGIIQAMQGTPAQEGQPFIDEQAQFMGQESPEGLKATPDVAAVPGGREAMVRAMMGAQDPQLRMAGLNAVVGTGTNAPSTIQEWNYYNSLPKQDQARFLEMKRNPNILNLGDTMAVRGPGGGINESYKVNLKPGELPSVRGDQAAAAEAGKTRAESEVKAQIGLPGVIAGTEQTIKLIDDLVSHPGMSDVVGAPSLTGMTAKMGKPVPGTDSAGFMARLEQLKGKQFLEAFESLKGGGQITEVEGKKATDAISRLTQLGQREDEYKAAAEELKGVLNSGLERARLKAGKSGNTQPSGKPITVDW